MDDPPGAESGGEIAMQRTAAITLPRFPPAIEPQIAQKRIPICAICAICGSICEQSRLLQCKLTDPPPRQSSVRSAIFIVQVHRGAQAPSGAACQGRTVRRVDMPLLTELERGLVGPRSYKDGAPKGAVRLVPRYEISVPGTTLQSLPGLFSASL